MYTVIRFWSGSHDLEGLGQIGLELNVVAPGSYKGVKEGVKGAASDFCSSVSDSTDWVEQKADMRSFLKTAKSPIANAAARGIGVSFDVAVWPEDCANGLYHVLCLEVSMLRVLGMAGVGFDVTSYCRDPTPED